MSKLDLANVPIRYMCQTCAFETTSRSMWHTGHRCEMFGTRGAPNNVPPTPMQLLQTIHNWVYCPDLFDSHDQVCERISGLIANQPEGATATCYALSAIFWLAIGAMGTIHAAAALADIALRAELGLSEIEKMPRA